MHPYRKAIAGQLKFSKKVREAYITKSDFMLWECLMYNMIPPGNVEKFNH